MKERIIGVLKNPYWILYASVLSIYVSAPAGMGELLNIPRSLILIWSVLLLLYWLAKNPRMFYNLHTLLFVILSLIYGIAILIHYQDNFISNLASCVYMAIGGVLFLNQTYGKNTEVVEKEFIGITRITAYLPLLYAIIALVFMVYDVSIVINESDTRVVIGVYENRLWGLYNANRAAAICMISIWSSILLLYKRAGKRMILYINIVLEFVYLVLTGCRGVWISFLISMLLIIAFVFIGKEKIKNAPLRGKIKYFLVILLAVSALFAAQAVVKKTAPYMVLAKGADEEITFSERTENFDYTDLSSMSNGRVQLWKAGLQVFREHPIFGVGISNIYEYGKEYVAENWTKTMKGGMCHNLYLTTLVATGILGFVTFMIFVIWMGIRCFKVLFSYDQKLLCIFAAEIAGFAVSNLFENNIIFWNCSQAMAFWSVCSYFLYYFDVCRKVKIKQTGRGEEENHRNERFIEIY